VVPHLPIGYWVEPTLFLTSDSSIQICTEEIFGPVASPVPITPSD
jgi:aldehyde dehydrogenase (NAD+)